MVRTIFSSVVYFQYYFDIEFAPNEKAGLRNFLKHLYVPVVEGRGIPFLLRYRMHVYQNSPQIPLGNIDILCVKELTELQRVTDITDRTKLRVMKEPGNAYTHVAIN